MTARLPDFARVWLIILLALGGALNQGYSQTTQAIYTDSLQNGWQDFGWAARNYSATNHTHSGSNSISVTCGDYEALYLHATSFNTTPYTNLTFWIFYPASGVPPLKVQALVNGSAPTNLYQIPSLPANIWTQVTIPFAALGVFNSPYMDGFWIQNESGASLPTFYVDDISLVAITNNTGTNNPANITVDAGAARHPISPLVYGMAFASASQVVDLNVPLNRSGGNAETRYNWQLNAHNHAADFYFESIADTPSTPGAAADSFISDSKSGGAQPAITIPMIGWAPKLGPSRGKLASYSITKYGAQTGNDASYFPDAGDGILASTHKPITNNNPNDANTNVNVAFQKGWVQHLTNTWGVSTNGGVKYYLMDNEHSIWFSTHQDVHPIGPTMQEIYGDITNYAGMVKSVDSNALVLGPEEFGWSGYFYSGYDQQWSGLNNNYNTAQFPDRSSNGGWDYMPWLLNQLHQLATNSNQRLLDYFTLHGYPQGNEFSVDTSAATQLLRNRSTRQYWDTNYVDASWINSVVELIPRMQGWVAQYYPGTKIGITEYNWGGETNINGATAQADILGIFGRQALDLGVRWTTPDATTPTYLAIKMYRNYDGNNSTFGDTSVSATGVDPDFVSTFAATRSSDGALTVMVVSKYLSNATPVSITVSNFLGSGPAHVWQLNASNVIARLNDVSYTGGKLIATVPGQSVTLFVLPAKPASLQMGQGSTGGQFNMSLNGAIGQTYILQSSSNLMDWVPMSTNTLISTQLNLQIPITGSSRAFYRVKQGP